MTDTRSPSPAAAPPVPNAPGPRAQALLAVFNSALDATLAKVSAGNFASCFPTPAKYVPEVLDDIHGQFTAQISSAWKKKFDEICAQRNVVVGLNELDAVLADARKRKQKAEREAGGNEVEQPQPMHTLSPQTLFTSHLHPFLTQHTATLTSQLTEVQSANQTLFAEIVAQRQEMDELVRKLEDTVRDLEKAAAMLQDDEVVQSLRGETRELDALMRESGGGGGGGKGKGKGSAT